MRRCEELSKRESCMNRARNHEMTFVLLGRDAAAPVAIRAWIAERIRLGKNNPTDEQITEAEECITKMEADHKLFTAPKVPCSFPIGQTTCGYPAVDHFRWDGTPMDHEYTTRAERSE
jgi:hypothetical protein